MREEVSTVVGMLAQAGFRAACECDPSLGSYANEQVLRDGVDALLEECEMAGGACVVDGKVVQEMQALEELCESHPDDVFGWAFDEKVEGFSPSVRRLLILLLIGKSVHAKAPTSTQCQASSLYLSLLALPGALSYQMYRVNLVRITVERILQSINTSSSSTSTDMIGDVVFKAAGLVCNGGMVERLIHCELLESLFQVLLQGGPTLTNEQAQRTLGFFQDMLEHKSALGPAQVKSKSEEEGDDDDEEYGQEEEFEQPKSVCDSNSKIALLKSVKTTLQNVRQNKSEWILEIVRILIDVETTESKDPDHSALALRLAEHLSFQVKDRADNRSMVASNILKVFDCVSEPRDFNTLYRFSQFLSKLSHSREQAQRVFATQMAGDIIASGKLDDDITQGLVELLINRSSDRAAAARCGALKGLGNIVSCTAVVANPDSDPGPFLRYIVKDTFRTLRKSIADPRPAVRKAAVQSMQKLLCCPRIVEIRGAKKALQEDFAALCNRARDTSPLIRNAVLATASSVFDQQDSECMIALWAEAVLPLVFDSESSVQKSANGAVRAAILERVLLHARAATESEEKDAAKVWKLLGLFKERHILCLRKAFWGLCKSDERGRAGLSPKAFIKAVQMCTEEKEEHVRFGAWLLLDVIVDGGSYVVDSSPALTEDAKVKADALKHVLPGPIINEWSRVFDNEESAPAAPPDAALDVRSFVLNALVAVSKRVSPAQATRIAATLFGLVDSFEMETEMSRKCLAVMVHFCLGHAPDPEQANLMILNWASKLEQHCRQVLSEFCNKIDNGESAPSELPVAHALFLVGEIAVLGIDPEDTSKAIVPFSQDLATLAMGVLALDQDRDQGSFLVSQELRAHAFVATGKLCLRDETTAKKATRLFVRELDQCAMSETVRSNAIVVLGDLCRRYTNMIDPHMDTICACLSDPAPTVRRNALVLLTGLLQEDYIKWRGPLFARYLLCAVDPDEEIRGMVRYAIKEIFPAKNPGLYHGQFVEVVHALNGCCTPKYQIASLFLHHGAAEENDNSDSNALAQARLRYYRRVAGGSAVSAALRFELYALLLDNMSDTHRLEVTNKLCRDVLGEILDGKLSLPKEDSSLNPFCRLLNDCFAVLCSPNIRVKSSAGANAGAEALLDEEIAAKDSSTIQAKMAEAKTKVLGKLERKNLTEHVIPLTVSFYRMLQREQSPHLRHASRYLASLMKSFKHEMEQVLGADKLLWQEIRYDLARFEKEEQRETERVALQSAASRDENCSAEANTPSDKRRRRSSLQKSSLKKSAKRSRRSSGITFHPSAKDVAARSSSGVLKTPIPLSARKRKGRRSSLQNEVERMSGPLEAPSRASTTSARKPPRNVLSLTMKDTPPVSKVASNGGRRWSLESSVKDQNINLPSPPVLASEI